MEPLDETVVTHEVFVGATPQEIGIEIDKRVKTAAQFQHELADTILTIAAGAYLGMFIVVKVLLRG